MAKRNVVMRHQYADYLNVSQGETAAWVLMGAGFTSLNEEPNAQSERVKYVNDKASSSAVDSYETTFPFEAHQIVTEEAIDFIYKVARNHCVGSDAEAEYCRVELWNPPDGDSPPANTYQARKFNVSIEVSNIEGDSKITISGNLNAIGDPVLGTFNTSTKTFTEATT